MKMKSFQIHTLSFMSVVLCSLFSSFTILAQDDPCIPAYRLSRCNDECGKWGTDENGAIAYIKDSACEDRMEKCRLNEAREADDAEAKCRAAQNKNNNSTRTNNPNSTTNVKATEDKIRAEREDRERARLAEEERARERTRAFNEQKAREQKCPPGATCVGRADISDEEATDERTRAFNAQKKQQSESTVQPSTSATAQTQTSNVVRRKPSKPKTRRNGRKKPR